MRESDVIYEILFELSHRDRSQGIFDWRAYVNTVAGADAWAPCDVATQGAVRLLCTRDAMVRLKWADLNDGDRRVLRDHLLPRECLSEYRRRHGGLFPWETESDLV